MSFFKYTYNFSDRVSSSDLKSFIISSIGLAPEIVDSNNSTNVIDIYFSSELTTSEETSLIESLENYNFSFDNDIFQNNVLINGDLEVTRDTISNSIYSKIISGDTIFSGSTNLRSLLGEDNTASNVGDGEGLFKQKSGVDLKFRSISGGTNTTVSTSGDDVVVDVQNPQVTEASAKVDTSTTSGTYVLMDSMTITPAAGTYMVWFSSSGEGSGNKSTYKYAIFAGGTIVSHTERELATGAGAASGIKSVLASQGLVTVNGSQAIEIRHLSGRGSFTIRERTLNIMKVN